MELTFKTERKKTGLRYLTFLPKSLRFLALLALIFNLINLLLTLGFWSSLQKVVPLFYSLSSDQQLANKLYIFILPGLATLINALHFLIAYLEKENNLSILKMFLQVTLLLQVLLLAILLRIIIIIS